MLDLLYFSLSLLACVLSALIGWMMVDAVIHRNDDKVDGDE